MSTSVILTVTCRRQEASEASKTSEASEASETSEIDIHDTCKCCLGSIEPGEWFEQTMCKHDVHAKCMMLWVAHLEYLGKEPTCPYCRTPIPLYEGLESEPEDERARNIIEKAGGGYWHKGVLFANEALSLVRPPPTGEIFDIEHHPREDSPTPRIVVVPRQRS